MRALSPIALPTDAHQRGATEDLRRAVPGRRQDPSSVFALHVGSPDVVRLSSDAGWWRGKDRPPWPSPTGADLRDLPFALLAEREQVAVDEVGMRGGEAVRQTRIVDFRQPP